jgi:hypothetical protein
MNRRDFLGLAGAAALAHELPFSFTQSSAPVAGLKPMTLGLLIVPFGAPGERIRLVHDLGFSDLLRTWSRSFAICWRSIR